MLSRKTIEPGTLELLKSLMLEPEFSQLRLVGGTSLALQYGHRVSIDLDFFGEIQTDDDTIKSILHKYGTLKVIKESANIKVYILNNIKIDIVNYNYKWIDAPLIEEDIRLATPKDIAAMKVNAIAGRGSKKDFIDMYFLLQHFSLSDILVSVCFKRTDRLPRLRISRCGQPVRRRKILSLWQRYRRIKKKAFQF